MAVWTPKSTSFMHELLMSEAPLTVSGGEFHVADVCSEAIAAGLNVRAATTWAVDMKALSVPVTGQ
jgi:hypothetical protein